ncbi:heavy metal transport/detoxification protein [Kosmotoga arenicorallina S304]|uniref:Heavy metal transport/detoxification protein n=1 Tax=Kosmotoga arenicorallina S304 TaxID=1453497 RepID=A0A176JYN9_9BACT|nr:cation transporter [Kosmotoga arenicorallina]OAA29002.1 heavy metal transport/detoxification protein [Kosmotoga arenicorallina S304]
MKLIINGMSCNHCKMRVEKALSDLEGVRKVEVDLAGGFAKVELSKDLPEELFKEVIDDAGYDLVRIEK